MICRTCGDNAMRIVTRSVEGELRDSCPSCSGISKMSRSREIVPKGTKEDRKKYFKSLTQPYRDGKLAKEFVEAYPDQVKSQVEKGEIKQKDVDSAKYMWKDLSGWDTRDKSL